MANKIVHVFTKTLSWQELYARGVLFLVATYEVDSLLAYLSKNGSVKAVLSEDGDMLVVYRCRLVLSKLDVAAGTVEALRWKTIQDQIGDTIFLGIQGSGSHMWMLDVCIMARGDYLKSLPGIGLKVGYKLMIQHHSVTGVMPGFQPLPPILCA